MREFKIFSSTTVNGTFAAGIPAVPQKKPSQPCCQGSMHKKMFSRLTFTTPFRYFDFGTEGRVDW